MKIALDWTTKLTMQLQLERRDKEAPTNQKSSAASEIEQPLENWPNFVRGGPTFGEANAAKGTRLHVPNYTRSCRLVNKL